MKKLILLILMFAMAIGISSVSYANDKDLSFEEICKVVEEHPELYGGVYLENNILHVIPLENTPYTYNFSNGDRVIYDDPQMYSYQQLDDAFLTLRENRNEYGITGYGIDVVGNGLYIYAPVWTDELKQELIALTEIETIEFRIDNGFTTLPDNEEDNVNDVVNPLANIPWVKYGTFISDYTNAESKMTVGAIAEYNGKTVLVTAGHAVLGKGDRIYLEEVVSGQWQRNYVGKVIERRMENNMDVCLIEFDSSDGVVPLNDTRDDGHEITIALFSTPNVGSEYLIYGAKNKAPVIVTCNRADFYWNNTQWFYDMVEMEYTSSAVTTEGDSGAPVFKILDGIDEYVLTGIYKGRRTYNDGGVVTYASKWYNISDYFDLKLKKWN